MSQPVIARAPFRFKFGARPERNTNAAADAQASRAGGDRQERKLLPAVLNGMKCRCPRCGQGKLFSRYLKVAATCDVCGEELFHHRADDLPPYLSVMIVGHMLVFVMLDMEVRGMGNPLLYMAILLPLAIILPLLILPSVKGFVVGLQWSARMHGFAHAGGPTD